MESSAASSRGTGRSGPRASLACMNCRQRKIKCRMPDPNASICASCRSLNLPCVVNKDGDRRKAGSRQHVAALQERLDYLESYIAKGHHQATSSHGPNTSTSPTFFERGTAQQISPAPSTAAGPSFDATNGVLPTSQGSLSLMNTTRRSQSENSTPPSQGLPGSSSHLDLGRLTPSSDKDNSRLDIDEADGQPRFYGPTSQPHIQRHSVPVESEATAAENEGLSIDSTPLRTILFQTYWAIQPNSVVVVDQTLFHQGRDSGRRSEYYSLFLEDALLASATRMSTSDGVRALGSKYVARAKLEITQELETPNTATLQGFLLLSDFEATRGRDRLGYLYCGIGCRLVFDLGIHESCADLVAKGKLSVLDAMWRHTLFLGVFVYDKLWSLYTGRPSTIPIATAEAAHNRACASGWAGPATLEPWVGLCSDMSEVTDILNGPSALDDGARELLAELDRRIERRSKALPPELQLDTERVSDLTTTAYSLHIQFCGIRIVLHRLLYKAAGHQTVDTPGASERRNFDLERSRNIMYESAVHISQLVSVYQQMFGIEQIITVMLDNTYVAATVLTSHILRVLQHDPNSAAAERDLQRVRGLADLLLKAQKHYPVTFRMRFSLSTLVDDTSLAGIFGTFAQTDQEPNVAAVTDLQPESHSPTFVEANPDFFQDVSGLKADMAIFQDWAGDGGDPLFQQMDASNMMSWALSPGNSRTNMPYQ